MNVGDHVIITSPLRRSHLNKEAVIVKKLIDDMGDPIYRVQIVGHKNPLPGWALEKHFKPIKED